MMTPLWPIKDSLLAPKFIAAVALILNWWPSATYESGSQEQSSQILYKKGWIVSLQQNHQQHCSRLQLTLYAQSTIPTFDRSCNVAEKCSRGPEYAIQAVCEFRGELVVTTVTVDS